MQISTRIHFTKAAIDSLQTPDKGKRAYYYDEKVRGLCVAVMPSSAKSFYVLRKFNGRTERVLVGRYPDTKIAQARTRAGEINSQFDAGINPNQHKRHVRNEPTLKQLFDVYMEQHARPHNKRPQNAQNNYRLYLSHWNNRRLNEICKGDVQALHTRLGRERGKSTGNIAIKLLSSLFNKAADWGLWQGDNPTKGVKKFKEKSRERFLLPDEMQKFLMAVREEDDTLRDFFIMLLLTGARRGNVQEMRWKDVHLEAGLWIIPDTKNGEPHTVPLVSEAIALMKNRSLTIQGQYVFPGDGQIGHLVNPRKAWLRILKRSGLEDMRMHDLRRTHGSWMAATGANLSMIGKALGHKDISTTAIYARLNTDSVRQAMNTATKAMFEESGNVLVDQEINPCD